MPSFTTALNMVHSQRESEIGSKALKLQNLHDPIQKASAHDCVTLKERSITCTEETAARVFSFITEWIELVQRI